MFFTSTGVNLNVTGAFVPSSFFPFFSPFPLFLDCFVRFVAISVPPWPSSSRGSLHRTSARLPLCFNPESGSD